MAKSSKFSNSVEPEFLSSKDCVVNSWSKTLAKVTGSIPLLDNIIFLSDYTSCFQYRFEVILGWAIFEKTSFHYSFNNLDK